MIESLDFKQSPWVEIKPEGAGDGSVFRSRDGKKETQVEPEEHAAWKQQCLKKLLKAKTSWQRLLDPASQKPYYYDKKSNISHAK